MPVKMPRNLSPDEAQARVQIKRQMIEAIHPLTKQLPNLRAQVIARIEGCIVTRRRTWSDCSIKVAFDNWLLAWGKEEGSRPDLALLLAAMATHETLGHHQNGKFEKELAKRGLVRWAEDQMRAQIPMASVEGVDAAVAAELKMEDAEEQVDLSKLTAQASLPKHQEQEKTIIVAPAAPKRKAAENHHQESRKKAATTTTTSSGSQTDRAQNKSAGSQTEKSYTNAGTQTSELSHLETLINTALDRQTNELQTSLNTGLRAVMEVKPNRNGAQREMSSDEAMMRRHQQEAEFYRARMMQSMNPSAGAVGTGAAPAYAGLERAPISTAVNGRALTRVDGRGWPAEAEYRMGEAWSYELPPGPGFRRGFY